MVYVKLETNIISPKLTYTAENGDNLIFNRYPAGWFLDYIRIENEDFEKSENNIIKSSTNRTVKGATLEKLNKRIEEITAEGNEYYQNILSFGAPKN